MMVFYIFALLTFLSIVFLLFLSWVVFQKMDASLEVAKEVRVFHEKALSKIQELFKEVSKYKDISETTQFSQEELEKEFDDLKETATKLQSAHKTRRAVLDLMKR